MSKLEAEVRHAMYQSLASTNPDLIKLIWQCLDQGMTPAEIEKMARDLVPVGPGVGEGELTMNAIFYAAQYIQMGLEGN